MHIEAELDEIHSQRISNATGTFAKTTTGSFSDSH